MWMKKCLTIQMTFWSKSTWSYNNRFNEKIICIKRLNYKSSGNLFSYSIGRFIFTKQTIHNFFIFIKKFL